MQCHCLSSCLQGCAPHTVTDTACSACCNIDCYPRFKEYQISVKQISQPVLPVGHTPNNVTVDVNGMHIQCPASFANTPVFA